MPIKMKSNYFPHDYNARSNPKLLKLQMVMGALGLAIFWCVIEMLWENAGFLPCMFDAIAYDLRWANAGEVQRVIEEFGLFESDGKRFWSPSVLSRMEVRQSISERNAKNGKEGGIQSGKSRRGNATAWSDGSISEAAASETGSTDEARASDNESEQEAHASKGRSNNRNNIELQKDIKDNPSLVLEEEHEKQLILELFFFKNYKSPAFEVQRFWQHYENTEWTTSDGNRIKDKVKVARFWKPQSEDHRFTPDFLSWYNGLFQAARSNNAFEDVYQMLSGLSRATMKGQEVVMTFATEELAIKMRDFVEKYGLRKGLTIHWKYEN